MGQIAWPVDMLVSGRSKLFIDNIQTIEKMPSSAPESERTVTMRMIRAHGRWMDGGRTVYELPESLTQAFVETDYPLTLGDVDFPLNEFFVHVPGSDLMVGDGVNVMNVNGMYVSVWPELVDIIAVGGVFEKMCMCHMNIPRGVVAEDWLSGRHDYDVNLIGPDNASQFVPWMRVVVGLCAYLAGGDPDLVREPYEQRRAHRDAAGANKKKLADVNVSYVRVGTRETLGEFFAADAETRKLTRRHVVRGHYRHLASGVTTWVRPYWKGPPWAEVAAAAVRKVT